MGHTRRRNVAEDIIHSAGRIYQEMEGKKNNEMGKPNTLDGGGGERQQGTDGLPSFRKRHSYSN